MNLIDLNTSYVNVNLSKMAEQLSFHHHLNTSYVNVNLYNMHIFCLTYSNLNTSYVNVNHNRWWLK